MCGGLAPVEKPLICDWLIHLLDLRRTRISQRANFPTFVLPIKVVSISYDE